MYKHYYLMALLSLSGPLSATTYWVSKTGNDQNSCLAEGSAECASIQKVLGLIQPGDTLYLKPGTYSENSSSSPYTKACYFFEGVASWCIRTSGTKTAPITLSAAPNSPVGSVILDNQKARVGILMNAKSYYHFQGLTINNSIKNAIANQSQAGNDVPDPQFLSTGVKVENCQFYGVSTTEAGDNIAAIGMWSSQDWVVRNNLIDGVQGGSGIRAYGVINALIEHNKIQNVSEGIMWKDHFITDLSTRGHYVESEIAYNLISAKSWGVLIQIRGANTPEAGHNFIHHNIFNGFSASESAAVRVRMYEAFAQSGNLRVNNNLFDCAGLAGCEGVSVDATDKLEIYNNIFLRNDVAITLIKQDAIKVPHLVGSNNNLFIDKFSLITDRYSPAVITYNNLAQWQAALDSSSTGLAFDHPDTNSLLQTATGLTSQDANRPYFYPRNRITLANQNVAGPYQLGSEVIGITDFCDRTCRARAGLMPTTQLVWHHSDGSNYLMTLAGSSLSREYLLNKNAPQWQLIGQGDVNADGFTDLIWRNTSTSEVYLYLMQQDQIIQQGYLAKKASLDWQLVASADLNADHQDELIWHKASTGESVIWQIQANYDLYETPIRTVADLNWQLVGAGDFDADGYGDLLWRNQKTGENYLFFMKDMRLKWEAALPKVSDSHWQIALLADLNADGKTDLVWRHNQTGENYLMLMDGTRILAERELMRVADLDWQIRAHADVDGDGKQDLFWRHKTTGETYLFVMDGLALKYAKELITVSDLNWQLAATLTTP